MPPLPRAYQLCPLCQRAVPLEGEQRCPHDGAPLLSACPHCAAPITSPFTQHCQACGAAYQRLPDSLENWLIFTPSGRIGKPRL